MCFCEYKFLGGDEATLGVEEGKKDGTLHKHPLLQGKKNYTVGVYKLHGMENSKRIGQEGACGTAGECV